LPYVAAVRPVQTNIVIFDVHPPHTAASLLEKLAAHGVKATAFGSQTIRFVTHLDITPEMVAYTTEVLGKVGN
jgi:threonine aldolase